MHELRAHPLRLLSIAVAALIAFTTTYAVGSYGATGAPASSTTVVTGSSTDPSQPPVIETPTPSPTGTGTDSGGSTAPAPTGSTSGGEPTQPAPTGQAGQPEPTRQAAEPAPDETTEAPPEPAPATSTLVVTPPQRTCGPMHDNTCE